MVAMQRWIIQQQKLGGDHWVDRGSQVVIIKSVGRKGGFDYTYWNIPNLRQREFQLGLPD